MLEGMAAASSDSWAVRFAISKSTPLVLPAFQTAETGAHRSPQEPTEAHSQLESARVS